VGRTRLQYTDVCSSAVPGARDLRDLLSFPTRRSSDLLLIGLGVVAAVCFLLIGLRASLVVMLSMLSVIAITLGVLYAAGITLNRSEEHTSELQSRENLVCRLLLEKKNHRRDR